MKNKGTIQYLVIASTDSKPAVQENRKQKSMALMENGGAWHKLHLAVDIRTHVIIAVELNASDVTDSEVLPHLFKQTR